MKTIFDEMDRSELIQRIDSLHVNSPRQWGKMTLYQMLKHCIIWDEWVMGIHHPFYKQSLLGKIFGKLALKINVKDDRPLQRNTPTGSGFTVTEKYGDVESLKKEWAGLIQQYAHFSNPAFIHDFFGIMTREEIGIFAYKHTDHHLRQFNC